MSSLEILVTQSPVGYTGELRPLCIPRTLRACDHTCFHYKYQPRKYLIMQLANNKHSWHIVCLRSSSLRFLELCNCATSNLCSSIYLFYNLLGILKESTSIHNFIRIWRALFYGGSRGFHKLSIKLPLQLANIIAFILLWETVTREIIIQSIYLYLSIFMQINIHFKVHLYFILNEEGISNLAEVELQLLDFISRFVL